MTFITLTLSPAIDVHCEAETFVAGQENLATVTDRDAGGKGVNISRALHAYGLESTCLVALGEENGKELADALVRDGLSLFPIRVPGRVRENITVHVKGGKETRLSFQTAPAPADLMMHVSAMTEPLCTQDTVLTLTGRVPHGVSLDLVKAYVRRAQGYGVRVVIDSRSFSLADLLEVRPFLIKPNEEEIAAYTGQPIRTAEEALAAARDLHGRGIENVMISLGGAGAVLSCDGGDFAVSAPRVQPISTIGAGDSAIAGFLAALAEGKGPADCLRTAIAFGSAACLTPGTRPPRKADILRLLTEIA